jgi:hypothetical protein
LENFEQNKFDSLPDFLKDKIRQSKEYKTIISPEIRHMEEVQQKVSEFQVPDKEDDNVPF